MAIEWKKIKLTKEEKEIEKSLLNGEYKQASAAECQVIARAITRRRKEAVLSMRINREILEGIKRKAKHLGVPYQTFISEILHRYAL